MVLLYSDYSSYGSSLVYEGSTNERKLFIFFEKVTMAGKSEEKESSLFEHLDCPAFEFY